ncbi:MAG: hypothetical protein AAGI12_08480 [Pseudomonadota bacterium]
MTFRNACIAATFAVMTSASIFGSVPGVHAHNGGANHTSSASFQSQLRVSCNRMWRTARKIARDRARRHCTRQHGSYRRGQIRTFGWAKGVCDRNRFLANGTLTYACK